MQGGYHSHAGFETECKRCHQPLSKNQASLCMECHTAVGDEIRQQAGPHGHIDGVEACYTCHTDHKGREFNILTAALARFDHSQTQFDLLWHQVNYDTSPLSCADCHLEAAGGFSAPQERCVACHEQHDPGFMRQHTADYGPRCQACHDGGDWLARFDHAAAGFPLEGEHLPLRCVECHVQAAAGKLDFNTPEQALAAFRLEGKDCRGCHAEPEVHRGLFAQDCHECHTAQGWTPALWKGQPFQHDRQGKFSLALHAKTYDGQALLCQDCHTAGMESFSLQVCSDCHAQDPQQPGFIAAHLEAFGADCLNCHDGVDRLHEFDHARFFPLEGAHRELDCERCHAQKVFRGTPERCVECHAEPKIHAGFFGLECADCHTAEAWSPAVLHRHSFPLDHGEQGQVACAVCHPQSYVAYTCYGCHDHQPQPILASHLEEGVTVEELPNCARCHPTGKEHEQPRQ